MCMVHVNRYVISLKHERDDLFSPDYTDRFSQESLHSDSHWGIPMEAEVETCQK